MRRLQQPGQDARAVFDACAARTFDVQLRSQLLACGPTIEAASCDYNDLGIRSQFHAFPSVSFYPFPAPVSELRDLYSDALRDGGERATYETLKGLAERGVCPQCGVGRVRTLDHYLPKARFAELAVVPLNLIPTCRDCNFDKREHYSEDEKSFIFHPYYDNWDAYRLVSAEIIYQPRPHVKYFIDSAANAPEIIVHRARTHFKVLNLAELYTMSAGSALGEVRVNCIRASASGPIAVQEFLAEHDTNAALTEPNGWRAAMFKAMSDDQRFWNGDYNLIR